jgi:hypothetical protein
MITAFAVLLFARARLGAAARWAQFMGVGFIVARLLFGHLPDQVGGARVTLACVLVEAVGLAVDLGRAGPEVAWLGAALAGGGYGLGFQGFGVEAVRRAPRKAAARRWAHTWRSRTSRWAWRAAGRRAGAGGGAGCGVPGGGRDGGRGCGGLGVHVEEPRLAGGALTPTLSRGAGEGEKR